MDFSKITSVNMVFCAVVLVLTACGGKPQPQQHAVPVSALTIKQKEVPVTYEYAARVVAFKETEVRARVGGILLHRNFNEGAEVKQGELLFEIDPAIYEAAVARSQAQVAQAQANYEQSSRDADRADQLLKQKVQSVAQRDLAFAKRDADEASLKQAKAELQTANLNLQYTKVTAPIDGLSSREAVSEGSLIGTDASSSLLTSITQIDPIYVNFSYSDGDAQQIKQLMKEMANRGEKVKDLHVTIRFGDGATYPEQGVIDFTSPTIDSLTGTLGVRAVVPNHDYHLVPGQFVRVTVVGLSMSNGVTIPEKALLQDATSKYVFVLHKVALPQNAGNEAKDQAPSVVWYANRRNVSVKRQLANRDWLLDPAVTTSSGASATEQGTGVNNADSFNANATGLNDGDVLLVNGQFLVQSALAALPAGAPGVPVVITNLDGKQTNPQSAQSEAGK